MKRMISVILALVMFASPLGSPPSIAAAASKPAINLGIKAINTAKSEISINLGFKIDKSTVNSKTVTVKNAKGWPVKLILRVDKDSVLTVKPVYRYKAGDMYTMSISSNLRFEGGNAIRSAYMIDFFIDESKGRPSGIGNRKNLLSVLSSINSVGGASPVIAAVDPMTSGNETAVAPSTTQGADSAGSKTIDYSSTNVQVKGVDEADIVKTDGKFIYYIANDKLYMASTDGKGSVALVDTKSFSASEKAREAYLDKGRLTLITTSWINVPYPGTPAQGMMYDYAGIYYNPSKSVTSMYVYDVSSGKSLERVRTASLDGDYLTSRMVDGTIYLVSNERINYYTIMRGDTKDDTPSYFDSLGKGQWIKTPYSAIRYFRDSRDMNYMSVATLKPSDDTKDMAVSTYLGSGDNVYCSTDRIYVANNRSNWWIMPILRPLMSQGATEATGSESVSPTPVVLPEPPASETTDIYAFDLDKDGVEYSAKGEVPGTVLNQFSMDESGGYFRIATTKGNAWFRASDTLTNNVYVLDKNLTTVGRLEGLAKGEKIYSARFMGDRAYIVTFRTVDPLFAIDLGDPVNPKVLGILKVPGVSDYLQPYDETHIIGFGKDAVEKDVKDANGNVTGKIAYYLGMKVALFDVSDVSNPKVLHSVNIGDRGTYSNLLYDHKALLFSKERNMLAFPVELYEVKPGDITTYDPSMPPYGKFKYQGEYVYKVSLENGFELRGTVSHMSEQEIAAAQSQGYNSSYDKSVTRGIYIDDKLYTFSNEYIRSNGLSDLRPLGFVDLIK